MHKKLKLGFSLIELSIVILVIGILVTGITQGSRIMKEAKLKSARALTTSSPVNSISNIVLWVDSTSEKSFDPNVSNGSAITTWYDLNSQAGTKNNAIAAGLPTYTENVLNGLPVVRFEDDDGSNDFLTFDGSAIIGNNYTVFLVSARRSNQDNNFIVGGTTASSFMNFHVGYMAVPSVFRTAHYGDGVNGVDFIDYTIPTYNSPQFQIHSITFDSAIGRSYYENGGVGGNPTAQISSAGAKTPLISWAGSAIGRLTTNYFDGDVAEIIIFNKHLKDSERESIEQYLSQKWGIKLS